MDNSYHQIAHQILRNEKSKNYDLFLSTEDQSQEKLNNEQFQKVFLSLKDTYKVIYRLFGEENFLNICYEYFKYNPIQSASKSVYGKSFPDFLNSSSSLKAFPFLYWLASLDWFWTHCRESAETLAFPVGTLNSWASIYKNQSQIDIELDTNHEEVLAIKKVGNEYSIVVK